MPRRKPTRAKPTSLNTDIDMPRLAVTQDMTRKEKEEQLEVFNKDIKFKVKNTLRAIELEAARVKLKIKHHCDTQLQQIPVALQDMTLREFAAAGGTFDAALKYKQERNKDKILQQLENRYGMASAVRLDLLPPIGEVSSDEQTEQEGQDVPSTVKSKKKAAPPSVMGPPLRKSVRASKSRYATPACRGARGRAWGATPAITPKFDPRLPITPENIREILPGERVMSMAGSPLRVDNGQNKTDTVQQTATPVPAMADMFGEFFSSHFGVNLTPTRVERALRIGGLLK